MKKIFMFIAIIFISSLIGMIQVNAGAVCVYDWGVVGKGTVTVTIEGAKLDTKFTKLSQYDTNTYILNHSKLKISKYLNSSNQFDCNLVPELYYGFSLSGSHNYTFNFTLSHEELSGFGDNKGTMTLNIDESSVDNTASENEDYMAPKTCSYAGIGILNFNKDSISFEYTGVATTDKIVNMITIEHIQELDYECPRQIFITEVSVNGSRYVSLDAYFNSTGSKEDEYKEDPEIAPPNLDLKDITCESLFYDNNGKFNDFGQLLQDLFLLIKVLAPILLIGLSSLDYIKAITSKDADELKKANERFVKRLIAAVALFLLPFILDFVFDIFGVYDMQTCGIK